MLCGSYSDIGCIKTTILQLFQGDIPPQNGIENDFSTHSPQGGNVGFKYRRREAESRNAVIEHAARCVVCIENSDIVTISKQVVSGCKSCRTGSDDGDFFT